MISATPAQMKRMAEVSRGYNPILPHDIIVGGDDLYVALHSLTYVISRDGACKTRVSNGQVIDAKPAYTAQELLAGVPRGYLYFNGLPYGDDGFSLKYPDAKPYDVHVATLVGLKALVERDIGYLPSWLAELTDPAEYLQVELEVLNPAPIGPNPVPGEDPTGRGGKWWYIGRTMYIEGAEVEND